MREASVIGRKRDSRAGRPRRARRGRGGAAPIVAVALSLAWTARAAGPPPGASPIAFREVAAQAGVSFRFDAGSRGRHDLPEVMGGGVALIDGDGDGWLDLYFCNGGPIVPGPGRPDPPCAYYRNNGDGTFTDATRD